MGVGKRRGDEETHSRIFLQLATDSNCTANANASSHIIIQSECSALHKLFNISNILYWNLSYSCHDSSGVKWDQILKCDISVVLGLTSRVGVLKEDYIKCWPRYAYSSNKSNLRCTVPSTIKVEYKSVIQKISAVLCSVRKSYQYNSFKNHLILSQKCVSIFIDYCHTTSFLLALFLILVWTIICHITDY